MNLLLFLFMKVTVLDGGASPALREARPRQLGHGLHGFFPGPVSQQPDEIGEPDLTSRRGRRPELRADRL